MSTTTKNTYAVYTANFTANQDILASNYESSDTENLRLVMTFNAELSILGTGDQSIYDVPCEISGLSFGQSQPDCKLEQLSGSTYIQIEGFSEVLAGSEIDITIFELRLPDSVSDTQVDTDFALVLFKSPTEFEIQKTSISNALDIITTHAYDQAAATGSGNFMLLEPKF